jgi:hypothetical protein
VSCKKEFPHLVEMRRKYSAEGLVAVSVSLDDPADAQAKEAVLKFLKARQATFTNVLLDETAEVWQEKLKFAGPPCFFVFNRDGKYRKFAGGEVDEDLGNVEKQAVEFLKKK